MFPRCTTNNGGINLYVEPFTVYRKSAALRIQPIPPRIGVSNGKTFVEKAGAFFIEIAPSNGTRSYDWTKKKVFAATALEMITLFADIKGKGEFRATHDPGAGGPNKGKTIKWLGVKRMDTGGGIGFTIGEKVSGVSTNENVVVGGYDLALLKAMCDPTIPYLYAWPQSMVGGIHPVETKDNVTQSVQIDTSPDASIPEPH